MLAEEQLCAGRGVCWCSAALDPILLGAQPLCGLRGVVLQISVNNTIVIAAGNPTSKSSFCSFWHWES